MLNPLRLIIVTADHTGRSLLFRFFGSTQLSSTTESTVELNCLGSTFKPGLMEWSKQMRLVRYLLYAKVIFNFDFWSVL